MRHLVLLTVLAIAPEAQAQVAEIVCDGRDRMVARLEGMYDASVAGMGLRGPDVVMELWASAATGDWALVQTYTNGQSCIVAMGENWEDAAAGRSDS